MFVHSAVAGIVIVATAATAGAAAPEKLNWYGDPSAPDISGVWLRAAAVGPDKEGWLPWPPPLNAPFAAVYATRLAATAAGTRTDDPVRACLPPGMPRFTTGTTGPLLIVQTPGRVTMTREGLPPRRIWTDGRTLPAAKDLEAFFGGNSVGHYDGATLVTHVAGLRDQPIDATGVPHSDDLTLTERYRRVDATTLVVDVTATDPTAFAVPMTAHVTYTAVPDLRWEPREIVCTPATTNHVNH